MDVLFHLLNSLHIVDVAGTSSPVVGVDAGANAEECTALSPSHGDTNLHGHHVSQPAMHLPDV